MAATGYRNIIIKGMPQREEAIANSASIKPGHLLEFDTGKVDIHGTADAVATPVKVAVESATAEGNTTASIDVAYASGDTTYFCYPQPGDVLYMWLATANNAVKGVSTLVSNGDGTLKIASASDATLIAGAHVGVPDEDLNNTSGSASRLKVRIV